MGTKEVVITAWVEDLNPEANPEIQASVLESIVQKALEVRGYKVRVESVIPD